MKLEQAYDDFMLAAEADGLKLPTLKWYRSVLSKLVQALGSLDIDEVKASHLREYLVAMRRQESKFINAPQKPEQEGGLSAHTIKAHDTALRAFFAWCKREYDIKDPMDNIRRAPAPQQLPKSIDKETFIAIFNTTGDGDEGIRDRAILAFLADTGCRLGGLISLTIDLLDLDERRAYVVEKGSKMRTLFFTHYTAQLLALWYSVRPDVEHGYVFTSFKTGQTNALTESGVQQMLKRLKQRAGVRGRVNPHAFRHNFAREYLKNGGDIVTLARLLGHTNINTTAASYAVFSKDELAGQHGQYSPMAKWVDEEKDT